MQYKILIIDDDKIVCKAIKRELESEGYHVEWALSGAEAIKMMEEDGFKIAIIDLLLPDVDGIEVGREIKKLNPEVKMVLISGHMNELYERKGEFVLSGGCEEVVSKPFSEGVFARLAKNIFEMEEC